MKIVAGDLYMYNDGSMLYIVKATGQSTKQYFSGVVVFVNSTLNNFVGEVSDYYCVSKFKRLSNKLTDGE